MSPESNIGKMKKGIQIPIFKFRNKIKSVAHSSNRKLKIITDIHELRRKKFWSGTSSHFIKEISGIFIFKKQNSHTYQEK